MTAKRKFTEKGKRVFFTNKKKALKLTNMNRTDRASRRLKISRSKRLSDKMNKAEMDRIALDFKHEKPPIDINLEKYLDDGGTSYIFYSSCPGIKGAHNSVVKMLRPQILRMKNKKLAQSYINMINQEALTHKTISDHLPNDVVKVFKVGVADNRTYILMERMNKINFRAVVDRYDKISLKNRVKMMLRVAEILKNVHNIGYFHMDLKPGNILLSRNSALDAHSDGTITPSKYFKIKLSDLGSAKPLYRDLRLEENDLLGTPDYMAPEQVYGTHNVDYRADIFSYGIVFHELLFGYRPRNLTPFVGKEGDLDSENLSKYLASTEPEVQSVSKEYKPLENLLKNCMRLNKNDRIQSMEEIHDNLSAFYDMKLN